MSTVKMVTKITTIDYDGKKILFSSEGWISEEEANEWADMIDNLSSEIEYTGEEEDTEGTGKPRYPEAHVFIDLSGPDGNAFAVIGKVSRALREVGCRIDECDMYTKEAMDGDYENLKAVSRKWVTFIEV